MIIYEMTRDAHQPSHIVARWADLKTKKHDLLVCQQRHSWSFEWGYGGSGPAELALAIITHAVAQNLLPKEALDHYQDFKWSHIAPACLNGFTVTEHDLAYWWKELKEKEQQWFANMKERHDDSE